MDTPRYFQWQNEHLLKTIYPLREMKLRDFLFYYQEIDLWAAYKDKPLSALQDDIRAHKEAQARLVREAVQNLTSLQTYFLQEDVTPVYARKFPTPDPDEIKKINQMHAAFAKYYPKLNHPRKEKYFIAQQIYTWEQHRKDLLQYTAQRQRRLNIILPDHPTRPALQAEIAKLQTITLPMVDEEYDRLRAFLSAHGKLENRKLEIAQARATALSEQKALTRTLEQLLARLRPLERQRTEAASELARLKNPPALAPLESYFLTEDVTSALQTAFPQANPDLIKTINELHHQLAGSFRYTKTIPSRLRALKMYAYNMQQAQRRVERQIQQLETNLRNMGPTWKRRDEVLAQATNLRETSLAALTQEIAKLNDYWAALHAAETPPAEREKTLRTQEAAFAKLDQSWQQLIAQAETLRNQLRDLEQQLSVSETDQLLRPDLAKPLTVKDIVRGKLEIYKEELAQKDHLALLEEIVQRFLREPARYPLWLQYMVIHFSGMRYKSAHGSWADPREILANLRTSALEKDFKKLDEASKDAILEQRLVAYGIGEKDPGEGEPAPPPPLAQSTDRRWQAKLARHLTRLQASSVYLRHKALFELLMDEENYQVEMMTDEEVRAGLEAIKDTLPDWMWKEIVQATDLRVDYVQDANWETLDAKEQAEKSEYRWQEYRQMLSKWKADHLTAWRDEHNQNNQLIVTRAVCNEIAEHIQHIRGNSPPGGLTAKPKWYLSLESAAAGQPAPRDGKRAHFIKPYKAEDFTPGASVLWLRFVNEYPNPWRIAHPITLKNGEGLLPAQFFSGKPQEGGWVYQQTNVITRTRTLYNEKKKKIGQETQYLRWIHEATVAEVAETADGPVVLTFETALPHEDRRLSSIGVFKHYLHNIVYSIRGEWFNASFVGYAPEGDVPYEDLEFMLDWNKILRRQVTPASKPPAAPQKKPTPRK